MTLGDPFPEYLDESRGPRMAERKRPKPVLAVGAYDIGYIGARDLADETLNLTGFKLEVYLCPTPPAKYRREVCRYEMFDLRYR